MNQPPEVVKYLVEQRHRELLTHYQVANGPRPRGDKKIEPWTFRLTRGIRVIFRAPARYFQARSRSKDPAPAGTELTECQNLPECQIC